jgi:acyl CoA:acetate/3-ketoacid CoA transferase beta subunit
MSVTVYSFIVISTGTNVQNCSTTLINNLFSAYANVLNISGQAAQLQQEAQQAANIINNFNIFNIASILGLPGLLADIMSRGMQLALQVPNVLTQMTTAISNATTQLPTCGPNAAATASQQLNTIWANVQSCVQSG